MNELVEQYEHVTHCACGSSRKAAPQFGHFAAIRRATAR
jgi:hypothetical protein